MISGEVVHVQQVRFLFLGQPILDELLQSSDTIIGLLQILISLLYFLRIFCKLYNFGHYVCTNSSKPKT